MRNTVRRATRGWLCVLAVSLALGATACGDDKEASTSANATTSATRPATPASPTAVTGDEVCGLLDSSDLAPLVYSRTSGKPEPGTAKGLGGCRWPVSGSQKDFTVYINQQTDGGKREDFGEFAEVSFDVNGSKMYRTTTGASVCNAVAFGPKVPATYYLEITYEADKSKLGGQDPCKPTLPVVSKVLTKLGW